MLLSVIYLGHMTTNWDGPYAEISKHHSQKLCCITCTSKYHCCTLTLLRQNIYKIAILQGQSLWKYIQGRQIEQKSIKWQEHQGRKACMPWLYLHSVQNIATSLYCILYIKIFKRLLPTILAPLLHPSFHV